ncbi:cytochrome P450 [Nocardia sp. NPDC060256]|uniref:cytochrome P450 n=1 Tax=unclassified Nocardia TaxID=2637762 RepID=UPI0036653F47
MSSGTLPPEPLDYPFDRGTSLHPHPLYSLLRRHRPVAAVTLPNGVPAYLVTRYADVRAVLEDSRFSRAALSKTDPTRLVAYLPPERAENTGSADHSMPYELLNRWFTPRAVERFRERAGQVAAALVDAIRAQRPPVDAVAALTTALPMTVMGELAGIPVDDRSWIAERAPLVVVESEDERSDRASKELFEYFRAQVDKRYAEPADDLLGHLVTAYQTSAPAMAADRLPQLAMRTCLPGFHSVSVTLSRGLPILCRQREILELIREQEDSIPAVVEELLRLTTPAATSLPRLTLEEVELAGRGIPAGSVVVAGLESANHDEARYPNPGLIDPGRGAPDHTTFGRGTNYCFGAALARMELQVALTEIARGLPGIELAVPESTLEFRRGVIAPDVLRLPIRW